MQRTRRNVPSARRSNSKQLFHENIKPTAHWRSMWKPLVLFRDRNPSRFLNRESRTYSPQLRSIKPKSPCTAEVQRNALDMMACPWDVNDGYPLSGFDYKLKVTSPRSLSVFVAVVSRVPGDFLELNTPNYLLPTNQQGPRKKTHDIGG